MATLEINGRDVEVDDSFLSLTPEQQNATVDEIAASLGASQPKGLTGSPGKMTAPAGVSENVQFAPGQAPVTSYKPDLMTATAATINGLVNSVPFLQNTSDALVGAGSMLFGKDYGETVEGLRKQREMIAQASPLARTAGELTGAVALPGAAATTKLGAEALGMAANQPFLTQVGKSAASMAGLAGLNSYSQGNQGADVLLDMTIGGATGAGAPFLGEAVKKVGGKVADTITGMSQRGLTKTAVAGAPTGQELRSLGANMFEQSRAAGIMVGRPAFGRLMQMVESAVGKFRPNANLDPKAMGALQVLQDTYESVMKPGSNVLPDLQDLHILRQAAQRAAISTEGRDATIANKVIDEIDGFIRTLKPADVVGGADPNAAANALLDGISTWHRAGKVSLIEEAIRVGEVAASGPENGIRNAFRAIIKNPALFNQFSKAEQQAIRDVAEGTLLANILKFGGKGGIGSGGNSWLGAVISATLGATSGFGPWGAGAALAAGSVARKGSELMTRSAADTASRAAATPNIPVAPQMPNLLAGARPPIELLIRGGGQAAVSQ